MIPSTTELTPPASPSLALYKKQKNGASILESQLALFTKRIFGEILTSRSTPWHFLFSRSGPQRLRLGLRGFHQSGMTAITNFLFSSCSVGKMVEKNINEQ